jgi:single-strand DNA-binding protein
MERSGSEVRLMTTERAPEPHDGAPETSSRNEVILCGRVSMAADERGLPSGDTVLTTRVVVDRPSPRRAKAGSGRSRQPVDAIDCVAWTARIRQTVRRWQPGDQVMVKGAIRRRFYRIDGRPVSRVEVEITEARRLVCADTAERAGPG